MKAYIETYGCALNTTDTNMLKGILMKNNVKLVNTPSKADFIFINTCAVKLRTERRMLSRIKELDKLTATLVVCGCLPKINWKELRKTTNAIAVGTNSLHCIPLILNGAKQDFLSVTHHNKLNLPSNLTGLVVPIPICEGCLGACAFCGTRHARGSLTSYPMSSIKKTLEYAVSQGAKEIQITAQDCGVYGFDKGTTLTKLLKYLLKVDGDYKLRIGMSSPDAIYMQLPELFDVFEDDRIYKFLHIPVQSGSDKILKLMLRKHSTKEFIECSKEFKNRFRFAFVSTDIITGFPGETREDFEQTLKLIRTTKPDMVNISKFFPRPNTLACEMKQIPTQITKQRSTELSKICKKIAIANNKQLEGKDFLITVFEHGKRNSFVGRSYNYKHFVLKKAVIGEEYAVKAIKAFSSYLTARTL